MVAVTEPAIRRLPETKLIGRKLTMSLANNRTFELWSGFMPRRKEIQNTVDNNLFSMQVYDPSYDFVNFRLEANFEKWAAVEVSSFEIIPHGMESFVLPEGLYAVFIHRGAATGSEKTFRHIFHEWLPDSTFKLDNRPHFEILGEKYIRDHPDSEEEVWIPVVRRDT